MQTHVRVSVKPGPLTEFAILSAAEGKHRVRASAVAHLNPHLPFVPGFLVNFVLKVASPFGFKMMKKVRTSALKASQIPLGWLR